MPKKEKIDTCPKCGSKDIETYEPCNSYGYQEGSCKKCGVELEREHWSSPWQEV